MSGQAATYVGGLLDVTGSGPAAYVLGMGQRGQLFSPEFDLWQLLLCIDKAVGHIAMPGILPALLQSEQQLENIVFARRQRRLL